MFGTRFFLRNTCKYIPKCRLAEKVAVVTASTDGFVIKEQFLIHYENCKRCDFIRIGFAIARRLGLEGAVVCISSRTLKKVSAGVAKLNCEGICATGIVCDVAKIEDRENLIKEVTCKFGGIDILVCNAGTNFMLDSIMKCDEKMWDKVFDVNLKSSFLLVKLAVPQIINRGGGSIVFVSSIAGLHPLNNLGLYSITKTAVLGLTKALAEDLAQDKINVNAVAPGIIKTKFSKELWDGKYMDYYLGQTPLKKFGEPDDIASSVAFLVSDDGKYMTGETIVVAGGMQSHL